MSAAQFLSLVSASSEEDEYTVRATLDAGIGALSNVLSRAEDKTLKSRFDAFVIKCLEPIANKLGWDPCTTDGTTTFVLLILTHFRFTNWYASRCCTRTSRQSWTPTDVGYGCSQIS